jgi:CubicO group peptidase (beta-lactamase class C family)
MISILMKRYDPNWYNSSQDQDLQQELSRLIPLWMEQYDVPGSAIALISNGDLTWSDAYGYASNKERIPMTPHTVCRVESISKSVTARGIMKLAESGKIDLDDPVAEYLDAWQFPETDFEPQQITIRQLLSHSSGLALGTLGLEYAPGTDKPSLTESLSKEVMMIQEPGKGFHYSNVGYHLLELLIQEVTGQPFSEYMRDAVLLPLGMINSDFSWKDDFITPVPDGHELGGKPVPVYVYAEKAAGGLFATAEDIAAFIQAGMLGDFYSIDNSLSEDAISDLYSPAIETSGVYSLVSDYYGLGHFIETLPTGEIAVFGGGQGHGWMTHFHLIPEHGDGIVILTNSSRSWPFISKILSEWTDRNGYGAVGMERISTATTVIWGAIALILAGCMWVWGHVLLDIRSGIRKFSISFRNAGWTTYGNLIVIILLFSLLTWIHTRDYLFLASVFPRAGGWFIHSLWVVIATIFFSLLFQKKRT